MIKINLDPGRPSRLLIAGAPEGQDARILADIAKRRGAGGLLHVSLDDHRMARLAEAVAFFAPEVELIQIPAPVRDALSGCQGTRAGCAPTEAAVSP